MIVMSPYADEEVLAAALSGRMPLVMLGGAASGDHPRLAIDNHAGAFQMTAHLLAAGHRRIAFIAGPPGNIEAAERLAGYRDALARDGATIEQVVQGDFTEQSGMAAAALLAAGPMPDAIFAANDMMAIGCLQGLRGQGIRVPDDVALAGFDDIPISRFVDPPLTSVGVPIAELGRQAVQCCVEILTTGAAAISHTFTPVLVVRASCGAVNPDRPDSRPTKGDAQYDLRNV
jgi:LacI family transcriptional regulator